MTQCQSAYRAKHSTTTALLKIAHDMSKALDKKLITVLLLLDFSKAFDMVKCKLLCNKFASKFRFCSSAVALINDYLTARTQAVCIAGVMSDFRPIVRGVP